MRRERNDLWWRLCHGDAVDWLFGALLFVLGVLVAELIRLWVG